jgi:hypothetical protein
MLLPIALLLLLQLTARHAMEFDDAAMDLAFAGVPVAAGLEVPAIDFGVQFAAQHHRRTRFTNTHHKLCWARGQRSIGLVKRKFDKRIGKFEKLAKAWNNAKGLRQGDRVVDVDRAMASSNPLRRHVFRSRARGQTADPPIHAHANQWDLEQTIKLAFGQVGQVVDAGSAYRVGDPQS